jgi:pyrroline-5-carboxylate reductase
LFAAAAQDSVDAMADLAKSNIGFIGGGNMAEALVRGLLQAGAATAAQLRAADPSLERRDHLMEQYGIETTNDNAVLAAWADVLVFAVKPSVMDAALDEVAGALEGDEILLSIVAGVPIARIAERLGAERRIVRAMPNTAAIALAGASAIAAGPGALAEDLLIAKTLFDAVGRCVVVAEKLLDAVTGLSGSGPAYVMLFIEALADGGVKAGLPRDVALTLAAQTVYGAAKLQLESGEHPGVLKDRVTSPGGTTIAGLARLEAGGFRGIVIDAVDAATQRSIQLGS